ncbi:ribonuclease PH [Candidatus Omnitrophus magneticus]|uniref:Ribonuclease PH n=1 Tax=Candidatus Omnitrophus magneticus TaxID=1609969 RepID=A0A0F0CUK3_9BACT|nr:ribonuclease PH [Candidatus Omnitrophus magneticus]
MRSDGRLFNELRKITVTPNYLKHAEGSCLIEFGDTKVLCSASVDNVVPQFLKGQGKGWVSSEYGMIPRSCLVRVPREATKGQKTGRTHEIQRLIGRSMRMACDVDALGERTIWLDCDVIQADGGTRCASITGSFIALMLALEKMRKDKILKTIPFKSFISAVSVGMVDGEPRLDLSYEEDSKAEVDFNVVMSDAKKFVEIQGTSEAEPFSRQDMDAMLDLARRGIEELIKIQEGILGGVIK